jgi:hypothetical protein
MPSTPIAGFITKSEAAEQYQRSRRQLSRDLSDAMKLQDPKVLEHCRLHTEDGRVIEGMGVTPEIIDQLCVDGKNPTWYLRTTFLEKQYGRRGGTRRQVSASPDTTVADAEKGSATAPRAALEQILRDRIHDLERDKKDLKEELRIKNNQIAERVQLEKQTNELVRNLHTLMADLQRRLLPPPTAEPPSHVPESLSEPHVVKTASRADDTAVKEVEITPPPSRVKKGSRQVGTPSSTPTKQRRSRGPARRTTSAKKTPAAKKKAPASEPTNATKPRSFLSRLFSR